MDRNARDRRMALLAARQGRAFSREQAMQAGHSRSSIQRMLDARRWDRPWPGVYVEGGTPPSLETDRWIAVLAVGHGAVISHESAGVLHGAERLPERPISLTVGHGTHQRVEGVVAHQIDDLSPRHVTRVQGLPVTTPARCVVELGATQPIGVLGRVADDLVNAKRTTLPAIAGVLRDVARPGKPGMLRVARMLDARGPGYVPPQSELERALFSAIAAGGLPEPVRQLPLPGRGRVRGVADAGYIGARVVIEADGRRWHTRVDDLRRDRERDAQVVRAGWVPLRFVYEQVLEEPAEVCAAIAETLAVRTPSAPDPSRWVPPLAG